MRLLYLLVTQNEIKYAQKRPHWAENQTRGVRRIGLAGNRCKRPAPDPWRGIINTTTTGYGEVERC